jgi:hypothetical protein
MASKWENHLNNAGAQIEAGVNRVSEAPGKAAARAADKFRQNILAAIESGRWANEVSRVSLEDWKEAMLTKGVPRIRAGTAAAKSEVQEFAEALFPHIESGQAAIAKMPSVTLDDNIARMVAFTQHMAQFTFRGG